MGRNPCGWVPTAGLAALPPQQPPATTRMVALKTATAVCLSALAVVSGVVVGSSDAQLVGATRVLAVVGVPTLRFAVPRYDTSGTYPQVKGAGLNLMAVNGALRNAVIADQHSYAATYARKEKARDVQKDHGVYRMGIDPRYLAASTVVVSALLPLTRELFPGQHSGDGWLGITVRVPSGTRVTITDLFTHPREGLRALATAYKDKLRKTPDGVECLKLYPDDYRPTVANYSAFALTPRGLVVGTWEDTACYRIATTLPYSFLKPYLSNLGSTLVAGARRPV